MSEQPTRLAGLGGAQGGIGGIDIVADRIEAAATGHRPDLGLDHAAHRIADDGVGSLDLERAGLPDPEQAERSAGLNVAAAVVAALEAKQSLEPLFGRVVLAADPPPGPPPHPGPPAPLPP